MFAWPQPTLQTQRLLLRAFNLNDAPAVQRLAGAREIADTTLLIPHPYSDGLAEKWISTHARGWLEERGVSFAIVLRETGQLCGAIGFRLELQYSRAEMGYCMGVPFWGCGYCTEAARALLRFGFEELNLHRVYSYHFARNPASGRVLLKTGMRQEGCLRQHVRRWENFEDLECYGIVRNDWAEVSKIDRGPAPQA